MKTQRSTTKKKISKRLPARHCRAQQPFSHQTVAAHLRFCNQNKRAHGHGIFGAKTDVGVSTRARDHVTVHLASARSRERVKQDFTRAPWPSGRGGCVQVRTLGVRANNNKPCSTHLHQHQHFALEAVRQTLSSHNISQPTAAALLLQTLRALDRCIRLNRGSLLPTVTHTTHEQHSPELVQR